MSEPHSKFHSSPMFKNKEGLPQVFFIIRRPFIRLYLHIETVPTWRYRIPSTNLLLMERFPTSISIQISHFFHDQKLKRPLKLEVNLQDFYLHIETFPSWMHRTPSKGLLEVSQRENAAYISSLGIKLSADKISLRGLENCKQGCYRSKYFQLLFGTSILHRISEPHSKFQNSSCFRLAQ